MVILEMLSRSYSDEHEAEEGMLGGEVDRDKVHQMAVDTYERGLEMYRSIEYKEYDVKTGEFLLDPAVKLETYTVEVREGKVHVKLPTVVMDSDLAEAGAE